MLDFKTIACALCAAWACTTALANRPITTDTADTIPAQRCQFEPFVLSAHSSDSPTVNATLLQLNCGVSESTQLGSVYNRSSMAGETAQAMSFGGKTTLVPLREGQTGIAVGYGLVAQKAPPHASWRGEGATAYLIASRQLTASVLGHANLGWSHSQAARQDSTTYALALEWTVVPRIVLSAETYGDDRSRPWASAGFWWGARENFSVNLSLGMQTSTPRVRQATAGFNFEF